VCHLDSNADIGMCVILTVMQIFTSLYTVVGFYFEQISGIHAQVWYVNIQKRNVDKLIPHYTASHPIPECITLSQP
jgi:hypothetical protein